MCIRDSIKAPLEAILETHEWNSEVESNLSLIQKNTNRLMELIKQLLDFRKVDKEGYTPVSYTHLRVVPKPA